MKNKKAISMVVSSVLMIAVTISLIAIVWGVVNNLVFEKTEEGTACSDVYGKIEINGRYTCYNSSTDELHISINRKDIDLDGILVGVESAGSSKSFEIENNTNMAGEGLTMYDGSNPIMLPEKNGGYTYLYDASASGKPDAISIAPIIDDNTCSEVDGFHGIEDCEVFNF